MQSENKGKGNSKQKASKTRSFKIDPKKTQKPQKPQKNKANEKKPEKAKKAQRVRHQDYVPGKDLKIIPLGGLGEIGKNMTAFEYGNDIVIVDV